MHHDIPTLHGVGKLLRLTKCNSQIVISGDKTSFLASYKQEEGILDEGCPRSALPSQRFTSTITTKLNIRTFVGICT